MDRYVVEQHENGKWYIREHGTLCGGPYDTESEAYAHVTILKQRG